MSCNFQTSSPVQDKFGAKQSSSTHEGLWSINNQNYLLPDLLQQSQISDSSANQQKVTQNSQGAQNKSVNNKASSSESTPSKSSTSSTASFTSFIDPRLLQISPPTSPVGSTCSSRECVSFFCKLSWLAGCKEKKDASFLAVKTLIF
ncbi:hypothetical protein Y1Q_0013324 [Alligator mississippiensis]|uniref:Uncharacterized protein n=1 Tax=Alligator mississippiensis TaxID=8496 RepID=A0A151NUC7_ALLMI|nr:hypothetical protein Y1Q_0013324 [Alligator mississippiensis]